MCKAALEKHVKLKPAPLRVFTQQARFGPWRFDAAGAQTLRGGPQNIVHAASSAESAAKRFA
jgi:hypothetical protein